LLVNKTIFISALDWGLGHATRCVPIIESLEKKNKVIIGITPSTQLIFEDAFPEIQKISVPAYNIRYSSSLPIWLKLMLDAPRIFGIIKREKRELKEIISRYKVDVVISDNRFGLYAKEINSILVTHQLFLKTPALLRIAQRINKQMILKFDEIWVPDFEDNEESLSGALSHGKHFHKQIKYIAPQSRLIRLDLNEKKYKCLFLISGPEPQQTIFKNLLYEKSQMYPQLRFAMVYPKASNNGYKNESYQNKNIDCFVSPVKNKLSEIICQSETVLCRSGYSSLMDLFLLNKKELILVPTPGQSEQEYLAAYWSEKFKCKTIQQKELMKFEF
jgi:UDP-N-acetylglucosamine:LPS N-acetylglucosamine transferase